MCLPRPGVRRDTGADTQVCPYDKHRKIFAQLLMTPRYFIANLLAGSLFIFVIHAGFVNNQM